MNAPNKIARVQFWADQEQLDLICITDTYLDATKQVAPVIKGYVELARRDRPQEVIDLTHGNRGGILVDRKEETPAVLSEVSKKQERIWFHLLTSKGPALIGLCPHLRKWRVSKKCKREWQATGKGHPW